MNNFLDKPSIDLHLSKLSSITNESKVIKSIKTFFKTNKASCNDIKSFIVKTLSNLQYQKEDKYKQHGWYIIPNTILDILNKLWNRTLSIVTSIAFQTIFFALGIYTFQSLFAKLFCGFLYVGICIAFKMSRAKQNGGTDWRFEPSNSSFFTKVDDSNISKKIYNIIEFTKTSFKAVIEFILPNDSDDEKQIVFKKRRIAVLSILVLLICIILF